MTGIVKNSQKDYVNRPRLSDEEMRRRMEAAGFKDYEIEEELAQRASNHAAAAKPQGRPVNHLRQVMVLADICKTDVRNVFVTYGKIPITFHIPREANFDVLSVDYEQIVRDAHNQQHGKFYDGISITLDKNLDVVKATLDNASAMPFERIRRITGYLVGDLDRFNDAKRTEVDDRVKHSTSLDSESRDAREASGILAHNLPDQAPQGKSR